MRVIQIEGQGAALIGKNMEGKSRERGSKNYIPWLVSFTVVLVLALGVWNMTGKWFIGFLIVFWYVWGVYLWSITKRFREDFRPLAKNSEAD